MGYHRGIARYFDTFEGTLAFLLEEKTGQNFSTNCEEEGDSIGTYQMDHHLGEQERWG